MGNRWASVGAVEGGNGWYAAGMAQQHCARKVVRHSLSIMAHASDEGDMHRSSDAVLQGLCGQLVLSYLDTEDLRACIETSRSLRSMASACVKSLAPRMGLEALGRRCATLSSQLQLCWHGCGRRSPPHVACRLRTGSLPSHACRWTCLCTVKP